MIMLSNVSNSCPHRSLISSFILVYDNMSESNVSFSSENFDNAQNTNSTRSNDQNNGFAPWNWRLASSSSRRAPTTHSSNNSTDSGYSEGDDYEQNPSASLDLDENETMSNERNSSTMVATNARLTPSTSSLIVNLLRNSLQQLHLSRPQGIIINHERTSRALSDRNILFDFFGGGDSPEAILEFYRRRIISVITGENPFFGREVEYFRNE